jgi:hypothetical protein
MEMNTYGSFQGLNPFLKKKNPFLLGAGGWIMPVMLAIQEAEIRRIVV